LKRWIDEGKPAIALVKYSAWSQIEPGISTQDSFTGPHFIVVVGYGNGNIYINDPNYWPPRREEGHKKSWSEVLFNLAWSNVRTSSVLNPNNSVIVPLTGQTESDSPAPETESVAKVTEYIVQPGDSWSNIAAKFYGDQSRYLEILAFNDLSSGAPLYVGQKLRIPTREGESETLPSGQPIVLGAGATQSVDADLVGRLKIKWVREGKLAATADETTVLRAFTDEIKSGEVKDTAVIEYIVQPGDTWSGIAGKFFGDQARYREIMEFNQLAPGASLFVGQKLGIPPK
jgi:nucleoid-associated protein YgaU